MSLKTEHVNLIEVFIKTLYLKIQERQLIHNELVAFSFDLILSFFPQETAMYNMRHILGEGYFNALSISFISLSISSFL